MSFLPAVLSRDFLRVLSRTGLCLLLGSLAGCASLNTNKIIPDALKDWRHAEWNPWAEPKPQPSVIDSQPVKVNRLAISRISSFRGIVPCSDCEHIELILTLRPDQVFFLRKDYKRLPKRKLDRHQEIGGWLLSDNGEELMLKRGDGSTQRFAIRNDWQLEILDANGKPITTAGNYLLQRLDSAITLIDSAQLQGLYYENGGRGYWLECQSQVTWPVARAGDYVQLSQQYQALNKPSAGATVLARVTAHLAMRQDEQDTDKELLVVDKFTTLENRFSCQ